MFHVERWQQNVSRGTNEGGDEQKMFHVEQVLTTVNFIL